MRSHWADRGDEPHQTTECIVCYLFVLCVRLSTCYARLSELSQPFLADVFASDITNAFCVISDIIIADFVFDLGKERGTDAFGSSGEQL